VIRLMLQMLLIQTIQCSALSSLKLLPE
jgi:hypothetical protein